MISIFNLVLEIIFDNATILLQASVKQSGDVSVAMRHVHTILQTMETPRERLYFVNHLTDSFRELIFDLHDYIETGKKIFSLKCIVD